MAELDTKFDATLARDGATFGVADGGVTNAKLDDMAAATIKGRASGAGAGAPTDLTANQVSTILDSATDPFLRTSSAADAVLADGDYGDVTVASSGTVITIDDDAVTYAKMQNVSATDRLLGRDTAAAGNVEELTVGGGVEFTGSTGIQRSALTGDVTAAAGSNATTIANDAVTNAKLDDMATQTIKGRTTAGSGDPEDLSATQATAILNAMVGDSGSGGTKGLAPAPASGDTAAGKFLKADGTWAVPSGSSSDSFKTIAVSGQSDVVADSATDTLTLVAGSNVTITTNAGTDTITIASSGGGSGTEFELVCSVLSNEPPSSNPATPDVRNGHPVLDFDGSTDEEAVWTRVLPNGYAGGGLTVDTFWAFTSATSGSLRVQAAIERIDASSLDIDSDSFASFNSAGGTAPGTTGQVIKVTVTFASGAEMDSLAAGELFRLKIRRDADGTSGTDDIATDAELLFVTVRET